MHVLGNLLPSHRVFCLLRPPDVSAARVWQGGGAAVCFLEPSQSGPVFRDRDFFERNEVIIYNFYIDFSWILVSSLTTGATRVLVSSSSLFYWFIFQEYVLFKIKEENEFLVFLPC